MKLKRTNKSRGFILLEVVISLIILSVVIGTVMRSFTLSLQTIRKTEITTVASFLTEDLMEEFEVIPPKMGETKGDCTRFGDKYGKYYYKVVLKDEEVKYSDGFKLEGEEIDELETLLFLTIDVYYDDPTYGPTHAAQAHTYLLQNDRFSLDSKTENAIF